MNNCNSLNMRQSIRGRATSTISGIRTLDEVRFASSPGAKGTVVTANGRSDTLADSDREFPLVRSSSKERVALTLTQY